MHSSHPTVKFGSDTMDVELGWKKNLSSLVNPITTGCFCSVGFGFNDLHVDCLIDSQMELPSFIPNKFVSYNSNLGLVWMVYDES